MFGIRILIYLIGIALVVWILFRLYKSPSASRKQPGRVDDMVKCEVCGVFVPRNEALSQDGHYYCSKEHRDQEP